MCVRLFVARGVEYMIVGRGEFSSRLLLVSLSLSSAITNTKPTLTGYQMLVCPKGIEKTKNCMQLASYTKANRPNGNKGKKKLRISNRKIDMGPVVMFVVEVTIRTKWGSSQIIIQTHNKRAINNQ